MQVNNLTLKERLFKHRGFLFLFYTSILALILGVAMTVSGAFSECITSPYWATCSSYFTYYRNSCVKNGINYCCSTNYYEKGETCGSYPSCFIRPFKKGPCIGFFIAGWSLFGFCLLTTVAAILLFCHIKRQHRLQTCLNFRGNLILSDPNFQTNLRPNIQPQVANIPINIDSEYSNQEYLLKRDALQS